MKRFLLKNIVIFNLRSIRQVLTVKQVRKATAITSLSLLVGWLDVFGLASIIPIISVALKMEIIHENAILNRLYNFSGAASDSQFLMILVVFVLFLFILKNILFLAVSYYQARFSYNISADLSKKQFEAYYEKNYDFYQQYHSSVIIRDIGGIPPNFVLYIFLPVIMISTEVFVFASIIGGVAIYNLNVFFILMVILGPTFFLIYSATKNRIQKIGEDLNELGPLAQKSLFQSIYGYIDVKLLNKESHFINKYINYIKDINKLQALKYMLNLAPQRILEITAIIGVTVLFAYTLFFQQHISSLITTLTVFMLASYRIIPSIGRMLMALMSMKQYQYVHEILKPVKELKSSLASGSTENIKKLKFEEKIEIRNLSFTYPGRENPALDDISISIKKGETVGFYGKSGAGKTTLMNVILRFLQEQKGNIVVDGKVLDQNNLKGWRGLTGYVPQNIFILQESLIENIAFGEDKDSINMSKMDRAVKLSNLSEFVADLPNGLNETIVEQGMNISGGQKQRIGIARSLYYDRELLILDEATSQMDSETEKQITASIDQLSKHKITTLIIAHRITTLKNCDSIYEMRDGKIIGQYNYKELAQRELVAT